MRHPWLRRQRTHYGRIAATKLVPVPELRNKPFQEAAKHEAKGLHLKLFTYSSEDYGKAALIGNGPHPEDA